MEQKDSKYTNPNARPLAWVNVNVNAKVHAGAITTETFVPSKGI